jgi:PKD repeat protein
VSFEFDIGADGLTVTFTGRAPRTDAPRRFRWDFGDGTYGEGEKTSHRYSGKGEYTVTLRVSGGEGEATSAERTIKVKGKP